MVITIGQGEAAALRSNRGESEPIDWSTAKVEWRSNGERLLEIVNGKLYGWWAPDRNGNDVWWFAL